jgi:N-acetylmuramoyl-L-alanine amidase
MKRHLQIAGALFTCLFPLLGHTADRSRVDVATLIERYGFPQHRQSAKLEVLESPYSKLIFHAGRRKLLYNGMLIWLNDPMHDGASHGEGRHIAHADLTTVLEPLLRMTPTIGTNVPAIVLLDPGHGDQDAGAVGINGLLEKRVAYDVAVRTARKLQRSGIRAILSRRRDEFVSLSDRAIRAKRVGAGLFISIHANSTGKSSVDGIETYVMPVAGYPSTSSSDALVQRYAGNAHDARNTALGVLLQRGMLSTTKASDRGLKRARFYVLREAPCPAALVECGFLSNKREARLMEGPVYRDKLAEGITRGIVTYVHLAEAARAIEQARHRREAAEGERRDEPEEDT